MTPTSLVNTTIRNNPGSYNQLKFSFDSVKPNSPNGITLENSLSRKEDNTKNFAILLKEQLVAFTTNFSSLIKSGIASLTTAASNLLKSFVDYLAEESKCDRHSGCRDNNPIDIKEEENTRADRFSIETIKISKELTNELSVVENNPGEQLEPPVLFMNISLV